MTIVDDKLIKESKENARKARLGMIWNKWRWVWPDGTPDKKRRVSRPSAKKEYRRKSKSGSYLHYCECGSIATVKKNNSHICAKCNEIEKRMAGEMR